MFTLIFNCLILNGLIMSQHVLPELPYPLDALEPMVSARTMDFHYNKHLKTYVENVNKLIVGTPFENSSMEEIVKTSEGPLFNNAAQALNHILYFEIITPHRTKIEPDGALLEAIEMSFGSFGSMKEQFSQAALSNFGSGWVFLVMDGKELDIVPTSNAGTPVRGGRTPIMVIDVWEHAYYLDHQNRRVDFIKNFWGTVNWDKVANLYEKALYKK